MGCHRISQRRVCEFACAGHDTFIDDGWRSSGSYGRPQTGAHRPSCGCCREELGERRGQAAPLNGWAGGAASCAQLKVKASPCPAPRSQRAGRSVSAPASSGTATFSTASHIFVTAHIGAPRLSRWHYFTLPYPSLIMASNTCQVRFLARGVCETSFFLLFDEK